MKYLIYGLSKSGLASTALLNKKKNTLYLYDDNLEVLGKVQELYKNQDNIKIVKSLSKYLLGCIQKIILSPSISSDNPFIELAKNYNIEIMSELELGYEHKGRKKLIAITGTNGKTTTTKLVYHILKVAGKRARLCGNIGVPITSVVNSKDKILVCEVSSFQLENISSFNPDIACILNITPDHLNRHGDMETYTKIKYNIFKNMTKRKFVVLNDNLKYNGEGNIYRFNIKSPNGCYIEDGYFVFSKNNKKEYVCPLSCTTMQEKHNLENIMCAILICKILKIKNHYISYALSTFTPPKHRLELIKTINNIKFYDDSKATNVDSTLQAIKSFSGKENFILILGGSDKGYNYDEIFKNLPKNLIKIYAMGDTKEKILKSKEKAPFYIPVEICDSLRECVFLSCSELKENQSLLLSPASASFNEFKNYKERGEKFSEYIDKYYKGNI